MKDNTRVGMIRNATVSLLQSCRNVNGPGGYYKIRVTNGHGQHTFLYSRSKPKLSIGDRVRIVCVALQELDDTLYPVWRLC